MAEVRQGNLPIDDKRLDVLSFQATVYIPLILTIVCSAMDILTKWQILGVDILKDEFIANTVLSYFFPTVFAAALGMLWTEFFGNGVSGVRDGFAVRFSIWTGVLFLVYMVSLFLVRFHWMPYVFIACLLIYVCVSLKRYLDFTLLRDIGLEKSRPDIKRASGGDA